MSSTAILIFARSAAIESNNKKIAVDGARNILLFEKLNRKIIALASKCNIPYFICDESCQKGNTFGENIAAAITTIFDSGFEKVLVVGNDCPQLSLAKLKDAVIQLMDNNVVVGPDQRGGTYLIGIDKSVFNTYTFSNLPWQKPHLCAAIESLYVTKRLCRLLDMNDVKSAKQLFVTLTFASSIKKILEQILGQVSLARTSYGILFYKRFVEFNFPLRAPPDLDL